MDPELRAEVEGFLRAGGDGLSHGAVFCLREQGLTIEEIAGKRRVSVAETKKWDRSLDHLFSGTLPANASDAMTNSYVYRYLLWCSPEDDLLRYARARLRDLRAMNSAVSFEPMAPRSHQYGRGSSRRAAVIKDSCPDCGTMHPGEC